MTAAQRVAVRELAADVGPAIVWSGDWQPVPGARWAQTDTVPSVHAVITADGGISTPLDARQAGDLPREPADVQRWERVVCAMQRGVAPGVG